MSQKWKCVLLNTVKILPTGRRHPTLIYVASIAHIKDVTCSVK